MPGYAVKFFKYVQRWRYDLKATLILENGAVFHGNSIGVSGERVFELVFNTSMAGYQELLTDPAYADRVS